MPAVSFVFNKLHNYHLLLPLPQSQSADIIERSAR
jgi:hypothetical protein